MIQTTEARELCSESEWAQVESSFSQAVEALPISDLKACLGRVKKLHQKSMDVVDRQHSDTRKQTTRRKTQLFAEAIGRFEAALIILEKAHRGVAISSDVDQELAEETRAIAARERADRELKSRNSHVLSAMAVRGEQQGGKSGATRIQSHVGSATRRRQAKRDTKNS
ncbi:MAG TPA: hypothetical protein VFR18_18310 [Terriglobia bacterium]|nr:hypothetical protein [Terriglobia bacterium]